jgi:hypothetical protein
VKVTGAGGKKITNYKLQITNYKQKMKKMSEPGFIGFQDYRDVFRRRRYNILPEVHKIAYLRG